MALKLTQDEENLLLERMRENPVLARRLFEMTDIVGEGLGGIDFADDAEDVVVENIRKTGKELLSTWAQKRADFITKNVIEKRQTRRHEKKSSNGTQH
jgi:hypothetical protein